MTAGTKPDPQRRVLPFRPLFFGAAAFAGVGMLLWGTFLHLGLLPEHSLPPLLWHGHAMLFGFAGALVGGFLLTAVANWTGRVPVGRTGLILLSLLWLLARVAAFSPVSPRWFAILDLAFFLGLTLAVGRVIVVARNRRNYFVIAMLLIYAGLDAAFFGCASSNPALAARALIWTVDWLTLLMLVIGGRVIPFFTGRRLPQVQAVDRKRLAAAVNVGAAVVLLADLFGAPKSLCGGIWLVLSLLTLIRMLGWRGWRTLGEPMLWSLHLGYLWLALGMLLRGAALVGLLRWPETTALHGITVGALGTLSLSMMTRVAQGHSGVPIGASRMLVVAFLLPSVAAVLRLSGMPALWVAAACAWTVAYLLYLISLGRLLVRGSAKAGTA